MDKRGSQKPRKLTGDLMRYRDCPRLSALRMRPCRFAGFDPSATRFSNGDAAFTQAVSRLGEQFAASHGAQAAQMAVATLGQQLDQQAALLSALDYFGFLAAGALVMAAMMTVQRVLK
jgi:hypothetical protein